MGRRPLFLLAAAIVLLYFTIIMFMLSPLNRSRHMNYGNTYMNHLAMRQGPSVNWCQELRFRSPPSPDVVALASYPGSGNTWLRYLLQQATGILTGSVYMDYGLKVHGFPAENITDGSVLVVKTHELPQKKFKSAIMLIRNPRDAILAEYNRHHRGHIGTAPKSAFRKKTHERNKVTDWTLFVKTKLWEWKTFHSIWFTQYHGSIHIVFYEVLTKDTEKTLHGILQFLNHTVTAEDMNCTLSNKEGIYRRKKKLKDFDPFTEDMYKEIEEVKNNVLSMVEEYRRKHEHERMKEVDLKKGYYAIAIAQSNFKV